MLTVVDSFFFFFNFLNLYQLPSFPDLFIFKYMGSKNSQFQEVLKCETLNVKFFEPWFSGLQFSYNNNSYNFLGL